MLGDRAQAILNSTKTNNVLLYTGFRPYVSDSGAKMRGPVPKPSRNVVTPRVATVLEQFKSSDMAGMAAV